MHAIFLSIGYLLIQAESIQAVRQRQAKHWPFAPGDPVDITCPRLLPNGTQTRDFSEKLRCKQVSLLAEF
jgi:hypothetical protein